MVIVQALSNVPVYFKYKARPASAEKSAIVVACVSALVVIASDPLPKASAIKDKLVFVLVPQVNADFKPGACICECCFSCCRNTY